MMCRRAVFAAACVLTLLTGCARYEYDIVQPQDLTGHVGGQAGLTLSRPPLEYRLQTVDNFLVMRVYNLSQDPIRLLGDQSVAVDPRGQSHPLTSQTIAAGTFVKLIFPPPRPQIQPTGPSVGFGFGGGIGRGYGYGFRHRYWGGGGFYDPYWDYPRYYTVYEPNAIYWDWEGETNVRLSIVYQRGADKPFTQEWVFHRRRM